MFGRTRSRDRSRGHGARLFTPLALSNLVAWYRADLGVTIAMSAVTATGTTPPAVTITGTPVGSPNIRIEVTTGGTLAGGLARARWSSNGGTSYTSGVPVTATVALGSTGLTANFAAGTYATDNVYVSTPMVSAWADQSGLGNNLTQATASMQPLFVANAVNGRPSARFDGVNDFLQGLFAVPQPFTMWAAFKYIVTPSIGVSDVALDGGNAFDAVGMDVTPRSFLSGGATVTTAYQIANTVFEQCLFTFNGASSVIRASKVDRVTGNAGALAAGGLTIGALHNGTRPANVDMLECGIYTQVLSAANRDSLESYLSARGYGV